MSPANDSNNPLPRPHHGRTFTNPQAQKLVISPDASDRVFPIRSVVSVDPTATPISRAESEDSFPDMTPRNYDRGRRSRREGSVTSTQSSPDRWSVSSFPGRSSRSPQPNSRSDQWWEPKSGRPKEVASDRNSMSATHQELDNLMAASKSTKPQLASFDDNTFAGSRRGSLRRLSENAYLPVTARFKHVVTDGGHAVITGRDGDVLQSCDEEPIHIPGAVQSFGLLIAFKEEGDNLVVRVVSENSSQLLGYSPQQLFQLSSFLNILSEDQADNLLDHLDFIRDEGAHDPTVNGPEVFMLSVRSARRRLLKFWCAMHISPANDDLVICELELEDDIHNPIRGGPDAQLDCPEDTLGHEPTPEEFAESTTNASKPLRVLRSARKRRGEAAAMEVFDIMTQIQEQLAEAPTLPQFLKILVGVIKELTGFHRVMIYQFDQDFNGRVVSELVDPRATKDLYQGLNFPASDIPKQARELYRLNKVRLLYDRDQETSRLVCRSQADLDTPLDMTFAYLRAMSPIHIKYLANMAVRSSMSISITAFGELWGLIACHAYGSKGMRVSFPIRKMCRLIGDTASRNIERLSYASRLHARKLINTTCTNENPSGYIVASSEDLLNLFAADFGALSIRDETKLLCKTESNVQELLAMLEYLRLRKISSIYASSSIANDFPDLQYPPGFQSVAGLLFVPLSSSGTDFIVFFRKSSLKEVKWAGNPYEKLEHEGTEGYLEPRKSFRTWSEVVEGTCKDWTEEEIETAAVLCLVYGKFIEVWRQKEAALQRSQLQRILLANSAHEVRTPLNAVINYLEIALEGKLDRETRDNLTRSHSASKSLVYVINDLLDLTKTENGLDLVKEEEFDFHHMLEEATEPFRGDAQRKGIKYRVNLLDEIPQCLYGDPRRIRQVISNIIANAVQNTSTGHVMVDVCKSMRQPSDKKMDVEFAIQDTGAGMSQPKVDALFRELEQVSTESDSISSAIVGKNGEQPRSTPPEDDAILGLGLAVVARAVRNMKGQLRLRTEEGKGSEFILQLTLGVVSSTGPSCCEPREPRKAAMTALPEQAINVHDSPTGASSPAVRGGDRDFSMTISRTNSQENVDRANEPRSVDSAKSDRSEKIGRNEVDRLIDDIQKPPLIERDWSDKKPRPASSPHVLNRSDSFSDVPTTTPAFPDPFQTKSADTKVRGEAAILDSRTPIKPIRIPDEAVLSPSGEIWSRPAPKAALHVKGDHSTLPLKQTLNTRDMSILVAEDDPINSKIMKKRLEKLGHRVHLTVNGEECSTALGDQPSRYDAILMDLQVGERETCGWRPYSD